MLPTGRRTSGSLRSSRSAGSGRPCQTLLPLQSRRPSSTLWSGRSRQTHESLWSLCSGCALLRQQAPGACVLIWGLQIRTIRYCRQISRSAVRYNIICGVSGRRIKSIAEAESHAIFARRTLRSCRPRDALRSLRTGRSRRSGQTHKSLWTLRSGGALLRHYAPGTCILIRSLSIWTIRRDRHIS
jgi:hypothetical protein